MFDKMTKQRTPPTDVLSRPRPLVPSRDIPVTLTVKKKGSKRVEAIGTLSRRRRAATVQVSPPQSLRELSALIVNLERRADRLAGCVARVKTNCPWLRYERFMAADGRRDIIKPSEVASSWHTKKNVVYQKLRAIRKGWNDTDSYVERTLKMSPGERGCALSHVQAWRRCLQDAVGTERPLVVFEDDAAPTPHFTETLSRSLALLPADAHVLYLGYSQAAEWRREISPDLVEAEYVWTTVAYMVWPAGARILLSRLPVDQPVDNWMANLCAEGVLKAYCVRPKVVHQAEGWNVNSDVTHSDERYWGVDSDIHHSDHLYPGKKPASRHHGLLVGLQLWDDFSEDSDDTENFDEDM